MLTIKQSINNFYNLSSEIITATYTHRDCKLEFTCYALKLMSEVRKHNNYIVIL